MHKPNLFSRMIVKLKSYIIELLIIFPILNKDLIENDSHGTFYTRSRLLRKYSNLLAKVMSQVNFNQDILVSSKGTIYTLHNGIYLNNQLTDRYFNVTTGMQVNEGKELLEFLIQKDIQVKQMIDVGACFGEISLWFSKMLPEAKVLAIEASPDNLAIFKNNLNNQSFPVKNITIVEEAVSDKSGHTQITKDLGSENSIAYNPTASQNQLTVPTDTLSNIIDRFNIKNVDFMKIDIEGAEPLLYECLEKNLEKIKSIYCEFSFKSSKENCYKLLGLFFEKGLSCYEEAGNELQLQEAKNILSKPVVNLCFINER